MRLLALRLLARRSVESGLAVTSSARHVSSATSARQVLISQSDDIFTNLALEDWLYKHQDFKKKPCVVIGRHQNPWLEANVPFLRSNAIALARRNSGGGTVYHDHGNLNCTFFTPRSEYKRKRNLEIVCQAINAVSSGLPVSITCREDIVLDGKYKVSGTASKLGKDVAYHHCTVLVDVKRSVLSQALASKASGIETRATSSVRSDVLNLCEADPSLSVDRLQEEIGHAFLRSTGRDDTPSEDLLLRGFQLVQPQEGWFPGVDEIRSEFTSQRWIFEKTPKFMIRRSLADVSSTLELEIQNGCVKEARLQRPNGDPLSLDEALGGLKLDAFLPEEAVKALPKSSISGSEARSVCSSLQAIVDEFV